MKSIKRREFLKSGVGCCVLLAGASTFAFAADEKPDPKKLNYCGYKCPDDCKMFLAGKSTDDALKREAFKMWRLQEKYEVNYSPEIVFVKSAKGRTIRKVCCFRIVQFEIVLSKKSMIAVLNAMI